MGKIIVKFKFVYDFPTIYDMVDVVFNLKTIDFRNRYIIEKHKRFSKCSSKMVYFICA